MLNSKEEKVKLSQGCIEHGFDYIWQGIETQHSMQTAYKTVKGQSEIV